MLMRTLLTHRVPQDKGMFSTLASELVDDDDDYLAIVLQEIAGHFALQDQPGEPTIEKVSNVGPLGATPSDAAGASVPAFGSALPAPLRRPSFSGATPRGVRGALPGLDQVDEL